MKKILTILIIFIFCSVSYVNAGCTPMGRCLIQINSHKEFIEFINNNPKKIICVDYKWLVTPIYYIWYQK